MQKLNYLLLLLSLMVVISCTSKDNTNKSFNKKIKKYTISGVNYADADSIFLVDLDSNIINSSKISNQKIFLQGKIKDPQIAFIRLNTSKDKYPIVLENKTYSILSSNNNIEIVGGVLHQKYSDYQYTSHKNRDYLSKLYYQFSVRGINLQGFLSAMDSIKKINKKHLLTFIKENENNMLSLYLLKQKKLSSKNITEIAKLVKNSTQQKLLNYLSNLYTKTIEEEAIAKIENRPKAKEFSGTNLNGRITSLTQVKRGKKAVLIDFWASWCAPCRALSPSIKNLYDTYKSKGFDIVTVSQDRSINAWEVGVYVDGMENWNHIYDEDNHIAKMYGVRGLPHMVLLDNKGRIIKNKISINNLTVELKKIFKNK